MIAATMAQKACFAADFGPACRTDRRTFQARQWALAKGAAGGKDHAPECVERTSKHACHGAPACKQRWRQGNRS